MLTAALSSVNCNLYLTARMVFSLARGGYAPAVFGRLSKQGAPVAALAISSMGLFAALLLEHFLAQSAYLYMLGAAFFGGLFVWMMIFATHVAFRRRHPRTDEHPIRRFAPLGSGSSIVGFLALAAVGLSTWWIPGMRITLQAGLPWLVFISLCYLLWIRRCRPAGAGRRSHHG